MPIVLLSDSTTAQTVSNSDSLFISDKATLAVTSVNATAITAGTSTLLTVAGTVYTPNNGLLAGTITAGNFSRLVVGGAVIGGANTISMGDGGYVTVLAGGAISSTGTAVAFTGSASGYPATVKNAGTISTSGSIAITSYSNYLVVDNTGAILADISGRSLVLLNHGQIIGAVLAGGVADTLLNVVNFGEIDGGIQSLSTTMPGTITNAGKIFGSILLGPAADVFDNTAGSSEGAISMNGGDDIFYGSAYSDRVSGGPGDDLLKGYAGDDVLSGDAGADTLNGGDGDDVLIGGAGGDILTGGAGADRFVEGTDQLGQPADLITDFESGIDKIDVSGVGAGAAVAINFGISNSTVYYQSATAAGGQGVISL